MLCLRAGLYQYSFIVFMEVVPDVFQASAGVCWIGSRCKSTLQLSNSPSIKEVVHFSMEVIARTSKSKSGMGCIRL